MVEFCWKSAPVPFEDFPDQEKVLLPVSYQQDAQKRGPELCRGRQGESFAYSFHIGSFRPQRRRRSRQATIEIKKKSQIGDGFSSGRSRSLRVRQSTPFGTEQVFVRFLMAVG